MLLLQQGGRLSLGNLPKVELHVHLEGCIAPRDAAFLLRRDGEPPGLPPLRDLYRHRSLPEFLGHFGALSGLMRLQGDPAWMMDRILLRLRRQGVVYAEIRVSPSVWERHGLDPEKAFPPLLKVRGRGIEHRIIVDAVRQWDRAQIERDLDLCLRFRRLGVVALGLGGDEASSPAAQFRDLAAECRSRRLPVVPHAGEALGPEEVASALEVFGPSRIGHGIAAAKNPALMAELRRSGVHLEVCPTSNRRTGVVRKGERHPFAALWSSGVPLSINTDDPALFGTTLAGELGWARRAAGLQESDLRALQAAAAAASFLPPAGRQRLAASL